MKKRIQPKTKPIFVSDEMHQILKKMAIENRKTIKEYTETMIVKGIISDPAQLLLSNKFKYEIEANTNEQT